jgi:hypothetical protein
LQVPLGPIEGLHCNWVVPRVLAMQRPSTRSLERTVLDGFARTGVEAVFNLQQPGEHASCGDGIDATSGFSYRPEALFARGIRFYLFPWRDLEAPRFSMMFDAIKVMAGELDRGCSIAVHCHAGLGRTGVAIACLILYRYAPVTASAAIALVRKRRPGSVQRRCQELFIEEFGARVAAIRKVSPSSSSGESSAMASSLDEVLQRQFNLLHGAPASSLRTLPRLVVAAAHRLEALAMATAPGSGGGGGDCVAAAAAVGAALGNAGVEDADDALIATPLADLRDALDRSADGFVRLRDSASAASAATILIEWLEALREPVIGKEAQTALGAVGGTTLDAALPIAAAQTTGRIARMLRRLRDAGCPQPIFSVACHRVGQALCGGRAGGGGGGGDDGGGDGGAAAASNRVELTPIYWDRIVCEADPNQVELTLPPAAAMSSFAELSKDI